MKTTLTRESASKVRLEIEATSDDVKPAIDKALRGLADQVKVPGFRKGKVPRQVLETRLGKDLLREEALREAVPMLLARAIEEESISAISTPSVEVTSYEYGGDLSFSADVEVRPEIALPDLDGIPVERPSSEPTDEEVQQQLERIQERFASLETVTRPARRGDYVLFDLRTTWNDQEVEQLTVTDQLYEVGSGQVVAKLDDELENARAGDIVKFNDVLPDGVGEEWAGREVTFQALVKEVKAKKLPDLDDEFAKTASQMDTLAEMTDDLRERIRQVKAQQADAEVRNKILEYVLDVVDVEPPDALIHEEMGYRLQRLQESLGASGISFERYLEATNSDEETLRNELHEQAERNVRAQLILEEVGRAADVRVTEEDLREEVRLHAESMRIDPADLEKQLRQGNRLLTLAGDIIRRKALNHLVERADITDMDATRLDEPAASPSGETQGA